MVFPMLPQVKHAFQTTDSSCLQSNCQMLPKRRLGFICCKQHFLHWTTGEITKGVAVKRHLTMEWVCSS